MLYTSKQNLYNESKLRPAPRAAEEEGGRERMEEKERGYRRRERGSVKYLAWFPGYLLWVELVCRIGLLGRWGGRGLGYLILFSFGLGLFLTAAATPGPYGWRRAFLTAVSALIALWASAQTVYYTIFSTYLTLYSVGNGGAALQFWRDILRAMGQSWYLLALIWAPFAALCIWGRRWIPRGRGDWRLALGVLGAAAVMQLLGGGAVELSRGGALSPRYLYRYSFIPERTAEEFGIFTTLRLDCKQLLFGVPEEPLEDEPPAASPSSSAPPSPAAPSPSLPAAPTPEPTPTPVVYGPNVMDIDFDALLDAADDKTLAAMHRWFSSREPTLKNEYTGAWEGKNLIFIVAEGFSRYAITEETTPTLYKLSREGFVCDEFYNPLWWVSTSDGEYAADTSLIPKSGVWSFYRSSENLMKFCLGNQLRAEGYATRAYHNHTYTYYKRHLSHPNMGYDYKGVGNGLKVKQVWPESDVEMMELTVPEYVGETPFHTYYMTVSGHLNYSFIGNTQAKRHRKEVGHEEMSEEPRAYLACQMELDQAVKYLLDQLEAAGQLENTALVLTGDHYPYGMQKESIHELVGHEVEENFETYWSTLILWSGDMAGKEPVHIEKPVCSLDILPTVSNLMGLEYDSRLLMGHDALSTYPGLAVLSDRSFITDLGWYNAKDDVFTPREGAEVPEGYVEDKSKEVAQMFKHSAYVLERDYYRVVFGE